MDLSTILESAQARLVPIVERFETPEANRLDGYLPVEKLLDGVQAVMSADGFYLAAINGMDAPATSELELLYHFCSRAVVVTLRTRVPYSAPLAPSICCLIPMATLYERELIEMFGVTLDGTPSTDKLLLPDDWPDGVYPLRKSFKGFENGQPVVTPAAAEGA